MGRLRQRGVIPVLLLLVVVNLPFLYGAYIDVRVDRDGVPVTATVINSQQDGDGGRIQFHYDQDVDPEQFDWQVALEAGPFERAVQDETVVVRVVPGSPNFYAVEGEARATTLIVLTVFADLALLAALAFSLRRRHRQLRLVATEDVTRARPGGSLERLSPTTYLVVGEVSLVEADAVVLDTGGQSVRIELGEFENPVGYQQPAQVRGRLPDSVT